MRKRTVLSNHLFRYFWLSEQKPDEAAQNERSDDCADYASVAAEVYKQTRQVINLYVDLSVVDEDEIRRLNRENRGVDSVTDVLSFPNLDGIKGKVLRKKDFPLDYDEDERALFLGSVAICKERAKEQAEEYGHSKERELCYLFTHSLFHLLGYDHMTEEDKQEMREKEESVLNALGITR